MNERSQDFFLHYNNLVQGGFLPADAPLTHLPDPYYEPWESLAASLPQLLAEEQVRARIEELSVLDTQKLLIEPEWQRAYVILGFLTHAYIWGGEVPSQRLPPQLTRPFLTVSSHLGLPPTATFSTLNLWNFRLESPDHSAAMPENLKSLCSFTNTRDEEWFYVISTAIEAKGAPLISTMVRCILAAEAFDNKAVLSGLESFTAGIQELGMLLQRMHERCDPQVFYHNVRPLCAGTKGMAAAGLPRGVFYDEGNGQGQWRQYSGGSNGQSSLIQLFDIFLAVDHGASGDRETAKQTSSGLGGYLKEMRNYMPRQHREFILHMEKSSNLREYISRSAAPTELVSAYNSAVAALTSLRNIHLQIVARYIVMPARSPPASYIVSRKGKNLATACSTEKSATNEAANLDEASRTRQLHGTGGTNVMPFLKRTRDETREAAIVGHECD